MWTTKMTAIFAILCCFALHMDTASAGQLSANLKQIQLPTDRYSIVNIMDAGISNETFVYMSCSNNTRLKTPDSSMAISTCRVTLDTVSSDAKFCDVKLNDDDLDMDKIVLSLSSNKAIVVWMSAKSTDEPFGALMLSIVHFDDGCKVYEAKIATNEGDELLPLGLQVLRYNDGSFDVLYDDAKKCDKMCKVGIDEKAKKIRDAKPWIPARNESEGFGLTSLIRAYTLVPGSAMDGSVIHDAADSTILMWTMDVEGQGVQKLLRNYTNDKDDVEGMLMVHSSAHKLLTFCWHVQSFPTKCEQMDFHGKTIVQPIDIPYSKEYNPTSLSVHSLSGGGFLVGGVVGCSPHADYCHLDSKYGITKYGKDGKTTGRVEIEGFKCDNHVGIFEVTLFEKEDGKYCMRQTCFDNPDSKTPVGKMNLSVTCFSDKDFS